MDFTVNRIIAIAIWAVMAFMTLVGIIIMRADKTKAEKGKWRVHEAGLFAVAMLLGGIGTCLGMYIFRHKTKAEHWYFTAVNLLGLAIHITLFILIAFVFNF